MITEKPIRASLPTGRRRLNLLILAALVIAVALIKLPASAAAPSASTQPASATGPATRPAAARLQFRIVAQPDDSSPTDEFPDPNDPAHKLRILRTVLLDESTLASATFRPATAQSPNPAIDIAFTPAGAKTLAKITREHLTQQLAILFDGKLLIAPTIHSEITGGRASISLSHGTTEIEAQKLADTLNALAPKETPATQPQK